MTKVAVVDDHGVVLAGLKFVLSRAEGMQVVATAETTFLTTSSGYSTCDRR